MHLEKGYYVVNGNTMDLISGPHANTDAAYQAWESARAGKPQVAFIIMWAPYENVEMGTRKEKASDQPKRRGHTYHIIENPSDPAARTHRVVKTDDLAPDAELKTLQEVIADLHATHGPTKPLGDLHV